MGTIFKDKLTSRYFCSFLLNGHPSVRVLCTRSRGYIRGRLGLQPCRFEALHWVSNADHVTYMRQWIRSRSAKSNQSPDFLSEIFYYIYLLPSSLHLSYFLESPPGFKLPYFCTHPPLPYYLLVFRYRRLEHGPTRDARKSGRDNNSYIVSPNTRRRHREMEYSTLT